MRNKKGQLSVEYTAVLAAMLVILILLIVIFNGIYAQEAIHTEYVQANHIVSLLATYASMQWAQGEGAHTMVLVDFPSSVKFENSSISNTSMKLYVSRFGDAFEITDFNLSGWWPNQTGSAYMSLRNNGSHILIRPAALISVSKKGFYFTSATTDTLTITNSANESFVVNQDLVFSDCASCTYSDEGQNTIASGGSRSGTIGIASLSSGVYSGYLQINTSPSNPDSAYENVTFNIPITVVR